MAVQRAPVDSEAHDEIPTVLLDLRGSGRLPGIDDLPAGKVVE